LIQWLLPRAIGSIFDIIKSVCFNFL
jgi:hypothetical protein